MGIIDSSSDSGDGGNIIIGRTTRAFAIYSNGLHGGDIIVNGGLNANEVNSSGILKGGDIQVTGGEVGIGFLDASASSINGNGGNVILGLSNTPNGSARVVTGDIRTDASNQAGNITILGRTINTTAGILNAAGGVNGGNVMLNAIGDINTGTITLFVPGFSGDSGSINLTSLGNIDTSSGVLFAECLCCEWLGLGKA